MINLMDEPGNNSDSLPPVKGDPVAALGDEDDGGDEYLPF